MGRSLSIHLQPSRISSASKNGSDIIILVQSQVVYLPTIDESNNNQARANNTQVFQHYYTEMDYKSY